MPHATPSPTPSVTMGPATVGPPATEQLRSYASAGLRETCRERDQIYETELASITCGHPDLPFDYSLFTTLPDMTAAYEDDVAGAETPPQPDGTCAEATFEGPYERGGAPAGRLNCREHTGSGGALYRVMEWTHEQLLVLGYISNRADLHSWEELISFWEQQAGPFPH